MVLEFTPPLVVSAAPFFPGTSFLASPVVPISPLVSSPHASSYQLAAPLRAASMLALTGCTQNQVVTAAGFGLAITMIVGLAGGPRELMRGVRDGLVRAHGGVDSQGREWGTRARKGWWTQPVDLVRGGGLPLIPVRSWMGIFDHLDRQIRSFVANFYREDPAPRISFSMSNGVAVSVTRVTHSRRSGYGLHIRLSTPDLAPARQLCDASLSFMNDSHLGRAFAFADRIELSPQVSPLNRGDDVTSAGLIQVEIPERANEPVQPTHEGIYRGCISGENVFELGWASSGRVGDQRRNNMDPRSRSAVVWLTVFSPNGGGDWDLGRWITGYLCAHAPALLYVRPTDRRNIAVSKWDALEGGGRLWHRELSALEIDEGRS